MVEALFYAVLLGAALGLVYDIFRIFRLTFGLNFLFDFLFWIISAFAVFSYLLIFNNGSVRAIYLMSVLLGFLLYIFTLGYVTNQIERKIAKFIKIRLKRLNIFKKVLQFVNDVYYNVKVKLFKTSRTDIDGESNGKGNEKRE